MGTNKKSTDAIMVKEAKIIPITRFVDGFINAILH